LNHAFREGHVHSDREWKRVKPYEGADGKRTAFLSIPEAKRLINACDPDFRLLVQAALLTGARYGSLTKMRVRDFGNGNLELRSRKGTGKERVFNVTLTDDEGVPFFQRLCAGRSPDELMLLRDDGTPWATNAQTEPMREACKRAQIASIGFN